MDPDPSARWPAWDLEGLLRSPRWRWGLAAALVAAVAALNAEHLHQLFGARRLEVPWVELFAHQLVVWGLWGLAGWPLFRIAAWLRRRWRSWILFFALQIPLSAAVAAGFAVLHDELQDRMVDPSWGDRPRGERPPERRGDDGTDERGDERVDERGGGPRRSGRGGPRGFGGEEWARLFFLGRARANLAVYWMVLGIGAVVTSFLQARDREQLASKLRLQASLLETELARAQLGSLRDQLRPHFIFNALHTVGALVQQDKRDEATRVLIALGDLLRSTLDFGDRQEVRLREELEVAEAYLDVERVRFGPRLHVTVDAAPDCLEARVPALLLQPLLENAVRHGIAPRTEGGRIEVTARREGDELFLRVRDDGPGFPPELLAGDEPVVREPSGRRSIGLANVRERARLLYGERQSFVPSNDPAGGAVVDLRIPFRVDAAPEEAALG